MKFKIKLSIALVISLMLVACGGGSSKPVKLVKVLKIVKEVETRTFNGDVSSIVTNTYDKNGFLIKKEIDGDANGQIDSNDDSYIAYGYGGDGVLSKKTSYDISGNKHRETYMDRGRVAKRVVYDKNGGIQGKSIYVSTYDDEGKVVKENLLKEKGGDIRRVIVFTYSGNTETQKYDLDMDGQTDDRTYIFTYNDRAELVKKERYNKNQELTGTWNYTYEHDENGNIITKTLTFPNNPASGETTVYTWEERSVPEIYAK